MKTGVLFIVIWTALCTFAYADGQVEKPYYGIIKSSEANIRTGPDVRYPIKWTYKRKGWPVRVVAAFEQWRKIEDKDGEIGWIHEGLLSSSRYAVLQGEPIIKIYRLPIPSSDPILLAEEGSVAPLVSCKNSWCKIELAEKKGWIEEKHLWGIDHNEFFE